MSAARVGGGLAVAALALIVIGGPIARRYGTPSSGVAADFALRSSAIALPDAEEAFPAGPHADVVAANCAACHSPSMILTQPPLTPEQWRAEVKKMREAYHAPVADADVPAILAYLNALHPAR